MLYSQSKMKNHKNPKIFNLFARTIHKTREERLKDSYFLSK